MAPGKIQGEYLVAEADESDASFLYLQPIIAIVTNIDRDHMETYQGNYESLKQAFIEFLHHIPFYGLAIVCVDDPGVREILSEISKPIKTYGTREHGGSYRFASKSFKFIINRHSDPIRSPVFWCSEAVLVLAGSMKLFLRSLVV